MAGSSSATTTERGVELEDDIFVDRIRVREGWKVKSHVHDHTHGLDTRGTWRSTNKEVLRTFPTTFSLRRTRLSS
jgi:hypothetical protein